MREIGGRIKQHTGGSVKQPLRKRIMPLALLVAFGLGFFLLGWGAGSGRIELFSDRMSTQNKQLPADLNYASVERLYDVLRANYDGKLELEALLQGLKSGLVEATGDPYTEYLDPEEAKEFNDLLSGSFTGIGAELGTNEDKNIIIVSPLSGYPAQKAGLRTQDIIAAVNKEPTRGMSISDAVRKIRGPADTKVTLTIIRGSNDPFDVTIKRQEIKIPSVESSREGDVGYIKINQFSYNTAELTRKAAQQLKGQNVKGIVLDLRGNPGGLLEGAVDIASLWLDRGTPVVQERRGNQTVRTETARGSNILGNLPTVILINQGSASASEIVAGALRDHKKATILGEKSFGKGSVQRVESLPDGSELKVTIARWFTPGGKNIDKQGITPDVPVKGEQDPNSPDDKQKEAALRILRQRTDS